jgi:tetratricopeptide (TPR) repeat protein
MTEHVHPNIEGQFLMADAFYDKIKELNFLKDWNNYITYNEAFKDIPIARVDSLKGKFAVNDLKKSWPYDMNMSGKRPELTDFNPSSFDERLAYDLYNKKVTWKNAMTVAYNAYKADKEYKKALHVAESLIFEYPEQGKVYQMAGTMCLNLGNLDKASYYFSKFNSLEKNSLSYEELALVYIKLNKIELAKKTLLKAKKKGLKVKDFIKMIQEENNKLNETIEK